MVTGINIIKPVVAQVSQLFGQNNVSFYKELGMSGHNGMDFAAPQGTVVIAPCDIEITETYYENKDKGYGTTMWARSKKSYFEKDKEYKLEFVFGHLSKFIVRKGEVSMGTPICYTGNTGKYTTGAHLHFGVRIVYRVSNGSWKVLNASNGYSGYVDPSDYWYKTMQKDVRFFKDYKSNAIYQLGIDGFFHTHTDSQLFQRLYGKFDNVKIEQLKVEVPISRENIIIASLNKFKRIFVK